MKIKLQQWPRSQLTDGELHQAMELLSSKLSKPDYNALWRVVNCIDEVASAYFAAVRPEGYARYYLAGQPTFLVYLIAGNVTKPGERKDTDILIAADYRYSDNCMEFFKGDRMSFMDDAVLTQIVEDEFLSKRFKHEDWIDLPEGYDMGIPGKQLLRLSPRTGQYHPIDVNYARFGANKSHNLTEEAVQELDCGKDQSALQRVIAYRNILPVDKSVSPPWAPRILVIDRDASE